MARNATKQSINRLSKVAERRVVKYLWGADAQRDWKEEHDISGPDHEGNVWIGEVKNQQYRPGPRANRKLLEAAFAQACKHDTTRRFAVHIPPGCQVEDAEVLTIVQSCQRRMSLQQFKFEVLQMAYEDHFEDIEDAA